MQLFFKKKKALKFEENVQIYIINLAKLQRVRKVIDILLENLVFLVKN